MNDEKTEAANERREFLKKGAYAAPTILTMTALPAFAGIGSRKPKSKSDKSKKRRKRKSKKSEKSRKSGKSDKD